VCNAQLRILFSVIEKNLGDGDVCTRKRKIGTTTRQKQTNFSANK